MREHYARTWVDPADLQARLGAVAEAYQWLRTVGLIAPDPRQPDDFDTLTRAARNLDDAGIRDYVAARTSCYELLDHRLSDKVWGVYLRGDYNMAVAYAFKVVEVRMREKAGLAPSDYGERLVKKFFAQHDSEIPADTKGMAHVVHVLSGAFDRYRNEAAHQDVTMGRDEAMELSLLANHCLRIVERAQRRS